jgi:hypothetical protein
MLSADPSYTYNKLIQKMSEGSCIQVLDHS